MRPDIVFGANGNLSLIFISCTSYHVWVKSLKIGSLNLLLNVIIVYLVLSLWRLGVVNVLLKCARFFAISAVIGELSCAKRSLLGKK